MLGLLSKKTFLKTLLFAFLTVFIPLNLVYAAASAVIITLEHNFDGVYYFLVGQDNPLKFGICDNPDIETLTLKVFDNGNRVFGPEERGGYTTKRGEGPEFKCNNNQSDIYGPKIDFPNYKPTQIGPHTLRAVYYNERDEIVLSRTMPIQVVSELPSDEEPDPGDTEGKDATFNLNVDVGDIDDFTIKGNENLNSLPAIANKILSELLLISGILALIAFIWGGYIMIFSGGDPGRADKGKKMLVFAFIGIVLIILSYQLIRAVDIFSRPAAEAPEVEYK